MTYCEQLKTDEWLKLREIIIKIDNSKCRKCYNENIVRNQNVAGGIYFTMQNLSEAIKSVTVHEFNSEKIQSLRINNSCFDNIGDTGVIYYSQNNNWTNIIAQRSFLENEKKEYNNERQKIEWKVAESIFKPHSPNEENSFESLLFYVKEFPLDYKSIKWNIVRGLQIHHKYYQKGRLAWEYPEEALMTLCWSCHENLHKDTKIEIRDRFGKTLEYRDACK